MNRKLKRNIISLLGLVTLAVTFSILIRYIIVLISEGEYEWYHGFYILIGGLSVALASILTTYLINYFLEKGKNKKSFIFKCILLVFLILLITFVEHLFYTDHFLKMN